LPTARQEQAPTDLTSRCAEINVVDLQEKVQEIGLAAADITLLLVNCDKAFGDALQVKSSSQLRQVKAYQRHFASMQFSAAKAKSCSQLVAV